MSRPPSAGPSFQPLNHIHPCSDPTPVDVTANTTKCHTVTGRVPRYQVIARFLHPRFNKFSLVGDLAVIHVEVDLKAKGAVPVPLLDRSLEVGESVKVFGWNIDFVPGYKEESLYLSKTKVIDPQICVRHYGSRFVVGEMLCMDMWKYKETTTEPVGCEMDTASVAVLEVDGKRYVGALALFAGGCMYEGWPGVYLNTFPYNAWIKTKLA